MYIYVAKSGDTVFSVAAQYGISAERLIELNGLSEPYYLTIGQALLILIPEVTYRVQSGDTPLSVARQFGIELNALYRNNPSIAARTFVYPGETLVIAYRGEPPGSYYVNGYAYPFINSSLLNETTSYLSYLSVFSYGFTVEGDIVPTYDEELLTAAERYGAAAILVLTPLDENGRFSNVLVSQMLNSPSARENLIRQLIAVMTEKGYYGLDIDFEFVFREDKDAFISFIAQAKAAMADNGFMLFVALAPKTSSDQEGLLYESHDYESIGQIADYLFVMTYEWGYAYGPPMAVAPLNKVRQVLDYAVSAIPPEKIIMGIPNYGYDWTLPYVRGEVKADSLGNQEAVRLAVSQRAEILFDETALSPYFFYTSQDGQPHVVWFEDVRSIEAKLKTASEYRFHGVGYWNMMRPFRQNWMLLNNVFNIAKYGIDLFR